MKLKKYREKKFEKKIFLMNNRIQKTVIAEFT
jgi:hypothetical protein